MKKFQTSLIDIIFLIICALLFLIPVSNINKDDFSVIENRRLGEWKPLFNKENKSLNYNFGRDFENWISDRFAFRIPLISAYKTFQYKITLHYLNVPRAYLDKKTNWEFDNWDLLYGNLTPEELHEIQQGVNKFYKFCNDNNIKLYVLIVPSKANIYIEKTFLRYKLYTNNHLDALKPDFPVKIIYPYDEIKNASKTDYVYFKTDHHWTDYGAYIGYKALIKEIKKDFPQVKDVKPEDFNVTQSNLVRSNWERTYTIGETSKELFVLNNKTAQKIMDTKYNYFTHKNAGKMKIKGVDTAELLEKQFEYPDGADLKLFLLGTSMNENLTEILPYSFKHTKYQRLNGVKNVVEGDEFKVLKRFKQPILDYKPDILVFCITYNNVHLLNTIADED